MRIAVAVALAAAAQLTVASATRASSVAVHSDLFYSTGDSCGSLNLPSSPHDVSGQLVKNDDFHGTVKLTPTAVSPAGCSLHVVVDGSIDGDATADAFAVASQVDAALPQFLATTMLRGAKTQDLTLQRLQVTVNNTRNYAIDTNVATLTHDETGGTVTLTGQGCGTFLTKDLVNQLFTAGADSVGELAVVPDTMEDVECSVGVHVAGRAPTMSTSNEMVAFLKGIDDGLNKWFDASSTNQPGATLDATHATFTMAKPMTLHAVTASNVSHVNAPTKQITLGILMGITVLSAMLFGTIYQKKRHEHHLQSRHHNASQAAQIHRVSYRMGYQRVDGNAPEFGAEEEEKDGLL